MAEPAWLRASRTTRVLAGRYELAEVLGQGRATTIFKASDLRLGRRPVAIKILEELDPEFEAAFDREVDMLMRLNHPSIPRLYDRVDDGEHSHLVMEYRAGTPLDRERHGDRIVALAGRLLQVLEYLHDLKPAVIHADINPDNVIVDEGDEISLVDFGSAQLATATRSPGTDPSPYTLPDQVSGGAPSPAWDLHAVAVILYRLTTGGVPQWSPQGTLNVPKGVSPLLVPLLRQALDRNAKNRFATAREFRTALERVQNTVLHESGCLHCGTRHVKGVLFCYSCGSCLSSSSQPTATPVKVRRRTPTLFAESMRRWQEKSPTPLFLRMEAEALARPADFDALMCIDMVDIEKMPHQFRAVHMALKTHQGRSILADEVGLGKTIEAGLVISELRLRGLARNVLIIVPSQLTTQWQDEMREKFKIPFGVYTNHEAAEIPSTSLVIASMRSAVGTKNDTRLHDALVAKSWDVIVVDEAHHARNRRTRLWHMLAELEKNYILLLTATPVHSRLEELYNLVNLVQPGVLGATMHEFNERYGIEGRRVHNEKALRKDLDRVMVRTRRSEAYARFPERRTTTRRLDFSAAERALYDRISEHIRTVAPTAPGFHRLGLISLQQRLTSCPEAVIETLKSLSKRLTVPKELMNEAQRLRGFSTKVTALMEILRQVKDRVVVFTDHHPTQDMLKESLTRRGVDVQVHSGKHSEAAIKHFISKGQVLVIGPAGTEGLNLHHWCHVLVNFDTPWNPLQIDQRIGRLQRLGQRRDVLVFNLVMKDTVEDHVLHILDEKAGLFDVSFQQVDLVLGEELEEENSFRDRVWRSVLKTEPDALRSVLEREFSDIRKASGEDAEFDGFL